MKYIVYPFLLTSLLLANDTNTTQNFETITVEGSDEQSIFDTPNYLKTQTFIDDMPGQKAFTTQEAMSLPGVMSDPLKALQNLAGVSVASSFSGELLIHGSKAYETQYTYNYLPLGYTFHFGGIHSVVSPDAIDQLNLYLGAFDVTYGNAMGGVVDITPKFPTGTNSGHVHIGLFDASASIDARIDDKTALYIGGRRSYFDVVLGAINPTIDNFEFSTFPVYYDLTTILSHVPNDYNILTFEAIVSKDATDITTQEASACNPDFKGRAATEQSFRTYGARWEFDNLDNFQSKTVFAYSALKDNTNVFEQIKSLQEQNDFKLTNVSSLTADNHKLTAGFEYTYFNREGSFKLPPSFYADADYNGTADTISFNDAQKFHNAALFAQDIYEITPSLKVRYGVRGNYTPYQNFGSVIDPRAAVIYTADKHSLSFATGLYSQFPVLGRTGENFSNQDLSYERSVHYSMNYKYRFDEAQTIEIEPYHKEFTALSVSDGAGKFTMAKQSILNIMNGGENGVGYATGLDATYKLRKDNLYVLATYSFLNSNRLYTKGNGLETFYEEIPQTFQIASSYKLGDDWTIAGLVRYRTGALFDRPIDTKFKTDENGTQLDPACYIANNTTEVRLRDFFLVNLKATKTQRLTKTSRMEYSFELMNATAYRNISGYAVDGETGKISESLDLMGIPFLPWIDITYRF